MVDVLFINPPSTDKSYVYIRDINRSGRRTRERIIWPQSSLAHLAAMVSDRFTVGIIDCIAENMNWKQLETFLKKNKPRYIVANVITSSLTNDLKVADLGKKLNAITIAIGPHVTYLPEETLRDFPNLDFVILGEAEITLRELINTLENKGKIKKVKGIAFRRGKKIIKTRKRPFVNLKELPLPRQDILPLKKYVYPFIGSNFTFVLSSRGCPYFCTFCRQPIMWGRKVRYRPIDSIIEELKMLKRLGVKNFIFHSDTFTLDRDYVINFCKRVIDEGLKFRWACNSRVDTVDKEMIRWMKKAGCWMIAYGIESGSQKILDNVKKEITLEQSRKAVKWANEASIKVYGYFVIGLPGETKQTIHETINFAKELDLTFAIFHIGVPYPGTEFFFEARNKGYLKYSSYEEFDQGMSTTVNYPTLSSKEIVEGVKEAYKEWYLRPKVIFNLLTQMKSFSDLKHLIKIAMDHIRWT